MYFDNLTLAFVLSLFGALGVVLGVAFVFVAQNYFNDSAVRARRSKRFAKRISRDPLLAQAFREVCDYHLNKR